MTVQNLALPLPPPGPAASLDTFQGDLDDLPGERDLVGMAVFSWSLSTDLPLPLPPSNPGSPNFSRDRDLARGVALRLRLFFELCKTKCNISVVI